MTTEPEKLVASIVASTDDKKLVSRIRMQKIVYLLQQLGAPGGFSFSYHHYGPYSRELDRAVEFAKAFKLIEEEEAHRQSDGASYSIFRIADIQAEELDDFSERIQDLSKTNVTVLELAATAHWLSEKEKVDDWEAELKKRKTWKTENGRLKKALDLLKELKLPPVATAA